MTTIAVFSFFFGLWYISNTNNIMAKTEAVSNPEEIGNGLNMYQLMSGLRDCARGIVPYVVFVIDFFVFICVIVCESLL